MDESSTYSWDELISLLGEPDYGGPFAEPLSRRGDEAVYLLDSIENAPYSEKAVIEWVAWRCAEPGSERCIAVVDAGDRKAWTMTHVCGRHRLR